MPSLGSLAAGNWEHAYRDSEHAYGEPIPTPPDDK